MGETYPRDTAKALVLRSLDRFDDGARVRAPVLLGVGRHVAQVPLGVEGALGATAGRGDGLAVGVIDEVADREDAPQLGLGGGLIDDHVSLVIQLDLPLHQLRARPVADRDEHPSDIDLALVAGVGMLEADLGDLAVVAGDELERLVGGQEVDVLLAAGALLHDLGGAELVAAVHDLQVLGELGDEDGVLHGRVAAADDGDVLALEEGAVADTAGRDAAAAELDLPGDAEPLGLRPHREDHRLGAIGLLADLDDVDAAVRELDLGGVVRDEARAETLGLSAELVHHLRAHHALRVARIVLDVRGVLKLPAPLEAFDDQRLELGARGVEGRRVAGGAAAQNDQVLEALCVSRVLGHLGPFGAYPETRWTQSYFTFYSSARSEFVTRAHGPAAAVSGSATSTRSGRSLPSCSQRWTVLRSWKKAMMPGGIGSQKAITR